MSLNEKQARFTYKIAKLIVCVDEELSFRIIAGELFRTKEQATWYAEQGKGIKKSLHCLKLALDLVIYKNGTISWDYKDYEAVANIWKKMDPDARWGGDFRNRDEFHFSFEHGGIK